MAGRRGVKTWLGARAGAGERSAEIALTCAVHLRLKSGTSASSTVRFDRAASLVSASSPPTVACRRRLSQHARNADRCNASVEPALQGRQVGARVDPRVVVPARREPPRGGGRTQSGG